MHDSVVGVEDPAALVACVIGPSDHHSRLNDGIVPVSLSWEVGGSCEIVCVDNV